MIVDPKEHRFQDIHKLMIGSIIPRPIAFVSTLSLDGIRNLAPFSYFNGVCSNPPTIMFAPSRRGYSGETKDTLNNIRNTEEFVVNIVSENYTEQMVACSTDFDPEVDEFDVSGLTPVSSNIVTPPRVKESLINFECQLNQIVEIGDGTAGSGFIVIGTVVLFHIDDEVIDDGHIKLDKLKPVGRLAGNAYVRIRDIFEVVRKISR